ncbi:hypothetical protein SBRCBS47491_007041 [Sporothrix bragantina]|uniref:Carboxymuconolactone decarboxylase-like domain-containing protein n=1 Tax=Sporothrix bragantina TaxID=671064 RepID=A0ABP0CC52_9PEZI
MAIWPFVGIPWVVPAALGSVAVLQRKGLEHIGSKTFREPMDVEKLLEAGKDINAKTYAKVNNSQVRELLTLGFPEMRKSMSALVWGYNVSGASKTGLLTEAEVELLIATAIVAGGATRQSKSHIKASLGMGNSFDIVEEVVALATEFNEWNNTPLPNSLSVEELSKEL